MRCLPTREVEAGTNTDVVPMRRRKRRTWGRQSTTNTYVGTITEYGGTIE